MDRMPPGAVRFGSVGEVIRCKTGSRGMEVIEGGGRQRGGWQRGGKSREVRMGVVRKDGSICGGGGRIVQQYRPMRAI